MIPGIHTVGSDNPLHAPLAHPCVSPADRLGATIFLAVLAHLILILGVTFVPEDRPEHRVERLDVVLVPPSAEPAPDQPDYLAQANRDGGRDGAGKARPERPRSAPPPAGESSTAAAEPAMPAAGRRVAGAMPAPGAAPRPGPASGTPPDSAPSRSDARPAARTKGASVRTVAETILVEPAPSFAQPRPAREPIGPRAAVRPARAATGGATDARPETDPDPIPAAPAATGRGGAAMTMDRRREIAALSAVLERKLRAYAERPRRKWISARTREHEFAVYMDAWRRKVEHVGNLNYPDEAARRELSGSLRLEVALNPDGTIEAVALRRSSDERILDDAAIHIVRLAAPFAEFPEGIAKTVDVLHIERTWLFHSDSRFTSP